LVFYNNLFSAVLLLPILIFEKTQIELFVKNAVKDAALRNAFVWGTVLSGASGLLINLAGFLQIKVTSPITHTVSSAARGVLQTIAAHFFLGEAITLPRCIGIGVTLFGSCIYSVFKAQESNTYKRI
jgi:GDP-fucose transporter C1